jgi:hypothetical protein
MASPTIDKLFALMVPKKAPKAGIASSPTYNPAANTQVLALPGYHDHLQTFYDNRTTYDTRTLLKQMFKQDPDVSAAVGAYLTMADTTPVLLHYDLQGQIDPAGTATLNQLVSALTKQVDYTQGFSFKTNLAMLCQELRYMVMLRGGVAGELVLDKNYVPVRIQQVDLFTIYWFEKNPGEYKPEQRAPGLPKFIELDIPSFFVAFHRRDPTTIYPQSDFVSAINTIASRQQVINELYRLMQVTGFPRIALKVLEEVLGNNAPANVRDDPDSLANWKQGQLSSLANNFGSIRSDQPFAHFDSIEPSIINEKNPGAGMDISGVIEVLNAQNQAALKTMATVIGRGNAGVNTASVEARIAAMNADQLNVPIKQFLDQIFTFMMNLYGVPGFAEIQFTPAELRPLTELEPQLVLRQSRLLKDLSLGTITDEEYHLKMFQRLPPVGAPTLSGTGFDNSPTATDVAPSANSDPLGRSLAAPGAKATKSNSVKNALLMLLNAEEESLVDKQE